MIYVYISYHHVCEKIAIRNNDTIDTTQMANGVQFSAIIDALLTDSLPFESLQFPQIVHE